MGKEIAAKAVESRSCTKHLMWIGVIAPLFIVAMVLIAAAVTPNYSHLYHAVSTLGLDGKPYPAILNTAMIVYGLAMCVYAYCIYDRLGRNRDSVALAILMAVHGIGIMFAGIFHDARVTPDQTVSAEAVVHSTFAVISYAALLILMCLFNVLVWRKRAWRGLIWFTIVVIAVSMPLLGLFIFKEGTYLGLFQRIGYGITLFWIFVVTLRIIWILRKSPSVDLR